MEESCVLRPLRLICYFYDDKVVFRISALMQAFSSLLVEWFNF